MAVLDKLTEPFKKSDSTSKSSAKDGSARFDPKKLTVIYVLGGPGAGKGTQCAKLVDTYEFVHLSAGDLLRAEQQREGSQYGSMIKDYIKEGKIVPSEVTIKLLENAMASNIESRSSSTHPGWQSGKGRFLIDGFPRKMDQALQFDAEVCPASFVLFYNCPEEALLQRLLERGKTSGRDDDNEESIKKRFRTFVDTSMPVVDHYRKLNKVVEIDSSTDVDTVHTITRAAMDAAFAVAATHTDHA